MKRSKSEWIQIVGHSIRNDTYQVLERIQEGETYEEIIKDLDSNREKYGIKSDVCLVSEATVRQYLSLVEIDIPQIQKEQEIHKKYHTKYSDITGYGVYGIFIDDKIIYIGQTHNFKQRFQAHNTCFHCSDKLLYQRMREEKENGKQVSIKPLINVEELKTDEKITERDIFAMELALITLYQPYYNYEGKVAPYIFSTKRKERNMLEEEK